MAITKVKSKYQVTIPTAVRTAAGVKVGDLLEATVSKHGIVLRPKVLIDKELEVAEAEVKAGRVHGPFKTGRAILRAAKRHANHARKRN